MSIITQGRRGRKPKDYTAIPASASDWWRQSELTPFLRQPWNFRTLRELRRIVRSYLQDRRQQRLLAKTLRQRLLGYFTFKPEEAEELIRAALDLHLMREDQVDPRDLPGRGAVVFVDRAVARVEVRGEVGTLANGAPDVSRLYLVVTSHLDGGTKLWLPLDTSGEALKYLRTYKGPLRRQLPMLWRHVEAFGISASNRSARSDRVYVSRLVVAIAGKSVAGMEMHHVGACGEPFGGFPELDCREEVLVPLDVETHKIVHRLVGKRHFHCRAAWEREVLTAVASRGHGIYVTRTASGFSLCRRSAA